MGEKGSFAINASLTVNVDDMKDEIQLSLMCTSSSGPLGIYFYRLFLFIHSCILFFFFLSFFLFFFFGFFGFSGLVS
jgi:hypothetical protein